MALFKILRGESINLADTPVTDGFAYFTPKDGKFYIDYGTSGDEPIFGRSSTPNSEQLVPNRICINDHTGVYQPLDADLTAIAGLSGTSGFLKKTGPGTYAIDSSVVSNTIITNALYATYGDVAELTVDRLITVDKIERYKNGDTSDINYIKAQNEYIQFITGTTTGTTTQHKNRNGELLYWADATLTSMGTTVTDYPVTIYNYTEMVKTKIAFKEIALPDNGSTVMPVFTLGAGTDIGDNAKGFIYKGLDGLYLDYYSTAGELRRIMLGDEGITITPYDLESIDLYNNGFSAKYNGTPVAMTWTLDAGGRITKLTTVDNVVIPVTWHAEDM